MYKKFTLEELTHIQNNFIPHLYRLIQQEKCQGVNDFFKIAFKKGNELYYLDRSLISFKISLEGNTIHMMDEVEKIEVQMPIDQKGGLQNLLIKYLSKNQRQVWQKPIEQILMEECKGGKFREILGKPYLVYDIETSLIPDDHSLQSVEYYLWYSMEETAEGKIEYTCIMKEDLPAFVEKMLQFDGYIVGFNQIYFDNPVCIYNVQGDEEMIHLLQKKSIDLYMFFQQMTGKRMGLNRISEALIGLTKNLEGGGASVETLWKERQTSWDQKILRKIQEYCKNDVRMTTLLFLYLVHFKKLYIEGVEYTYDIPTFIQYAKTLEKKIDLNTLRNPSLL